MASESKKRPSKSKKKGAKAGRSGSNEKSAGTGAGSKSPDAFPIVGLGGSAGGLEALEAFFAQMPPNSGMAFVVVTHQHPGHTSLLPELLGKRTAMHVEPARDGVRVQRDTVYVSPPGAYLAVLKGRLQLMDIGPGKEFHTPIDYFFRSLAQDQERKAIAIVLSGSGSDGSQGVREVKGHGGLTIAQEPETAHYGDMPRNAIATGDVDLVLAPGVMHEAIASYGAWPAPDLVKTAEPAERKALSTLEKVFVQLRMRTGHDFSEYKLTTVRRRIERRMSVHRITDLADYVRFLQENPEEVDQLFRELLIGVTSFFRDAEAFDALKDGPLKQLLRSKERDADIRVWVPGCSTGEEVYSIAIVIFELKKELGLANEVQVFGTDIDHVAVETARTGLYPEGIANDVSPERLKRFFSKENGSYRIAKVIRDMVVFAQQDLLKDPPFIRMDLISCRNLLIYLNTALQERVIPLLYFSLRSDGLLFLGASETVGRYTNLFRSKDRKWKVYVKKEGVAVHPTLGPFRPLPELAEIPQAPRTPGPAPSRPRLSDTISQLLLSRYVPAGVLANQKGDILFVQGRTGAYLEPVPGGAHWNVLDMARSGLKLDLASTFRQALTKEGPVEAPGIVVRSNGDENVIDLRVERLNDPENLRGLVMITFHPVPPKPEGGGKSAPRPKRSRKREEDLESELTRTKEALQSVVEELETSNEELKATNEELQSTNEELQSTNEELETSKEETQSLNEELNTVNAELQAKVEELSRANEDMENLLNATHMATVFLDNDLRIERFTDAAKKIMNLLPGDLGRPFSDISPNLDYPELEDDLRAVLDTLVPKEGQVRATDGAWHLMHIVPYRTRENVIRGAVLSFVNVDTVKRAQITGEKASKLYESILQTVHEPVLVLEANLRVISANGPFYTAFRSAPSQVEGRLIYDLGNGQWDIAELRELLKSVTMADQSFQDYRVDHTFPKIGRRVMLLNARAVSSDREGGRLILLAINDVTESASRSGA